MKKIIVALILLLLILSPRIYWQIKEERVLDIVVIDKSVAKKDYREHKGFFHILDSKKIIRADGEFYDLGRDYYGFDPYDQVAMTPFRARLADLIYVADTYGVFSDDLKKSPEGERSELIYGGMELLEWNELMASRDENTTLIAEFNSFASPTSDEVSGIMQKSLGVNWSGWVGRHFTDLSSDEVPQWLIDSYQQQTGDDWILAGAGLAFVHTSGQVVVLDGQQTKSAARFKLTTMGEKKFPKVNASSYIYWFDVVEPVGETKVYATYEFDLTEKGRSVLHDAGIPEKFPAVLHQESKNTYYFAGDYADFDMQPLVKWQGVHNFYKYFAKDVSAFYWLTYFPMMEAILEETVERKDGEPSEG
ncbi:hypothetical protein DV702_10645 [Sporosarcina sp. PTS2304]|uniref:hypothetical protein n=1 Tax=Sporosarcina sp. PTS2304 TaxID=2283194 RepID=UPI000E0DBE10|nr:hypothetical protein [Sporosarcina sp. PTS2304]AXI00135.1 hypothetical protein DV702_10645 [Sporosarcina sp. PTS2304]